MIKGGQVMHNNLTNKELNYLEDNLNHEMLLVKKFRAYADQCQDPTLKQTCNKIADKHAGHFDILLHYLNK